MQRQTIAQVFAQRRQKQQVTLMPFVPAGFPDLETTQALLPALEKAGAGIIEIGIPFSDPVADGPTIQEAFGYALAKKVTVADIFAVIARARAAVGIPLVAMVSYSIVYRYGLERFLKEAKSAGFDGLILPDLPPPEAQAVCGRVRAAGLETILLVAPTTDMQRRKEIAELSSGFVYYLSVTGITGTRDLLPEDLAENVRQLKTLTDKPVCVGFGITTRQHVQQVALVADGAIVGSALVKRIKENQLAGPVRIAQVAGDYCRQLLGGE